MDRRLAQHRFFAGTYSIADMAIYPWTRSHAHQGIDLAAYPNVQRWYEEISGRPAVQRGLKVLESQRRVLTDDRARENLFGATQYQRR
jgi:GST-like protein